MQILKKSITKSEKTNNKKSSYFYYPGEIPLNIKLNTNEGDFNIFLEIDGEVEIKFVCKDGFDNIANTQYILEKIENDKELDEFLKNKEIISSNYFRIVIEKDGELFETKYTLNYINELLNYTDDDFLNLIKKYINEGVVNVFK